MAGPHDASVVGAGSVAIQHEMPPRSARQQTEHQPHRGAGITAIKNVLRFLETIEAHPFHGDNFPSFDRSDADPHGPQASRRADRILRR